jgi:oxalate decarboxylase
LTFLEMFRSPRFADVSLAQWLALTPPELVRAHLNVDEKTMSALAARKDKPLVVR